MKIAKGHWWIVALFAFGVLSSLPWEKTRKYSNESVEVTYAKCLAEGKACSRLSIKRHKW